MVFGFSNGPSLNSFLNDPSSFHGETLTRAVTDKGFGKNRCALVTRVVETLEERYEDLAEGVIEASSIANFARWPVYDKDTKESIKG